MSGQEPVPISSQAPTVAVVGGGLAGLAAAVALAERGLRVELFELRRRLGGRAGSFPDPKAGHWIDHCQHVSMACCTNLADFCQRAGVAGCFTRHRRLHFFAPRGRRCGFQAARWLPAPLHLLPGLMRLGYLSLRDRLGIVRAMGRLARSGEARADGPESTVGRWLREQGQSPAAVERFWSPVLLGALSETPERASLAAARKVFVDGFLSAREAYELEVPRVPLAEVFDRRLGAWLAARGVTIRLGARVREIEGDAAGVRGLVLADGTRRPFDFVICAVPWREAPRLFGPALAGAGPGLAAAAKIEPCAITALHLWFDRPITRLPHAVLVGRLGQWLFNHGPRAMEGAGPAGAHYCQVVVSASHAAITAGREAALLQVAEELRQVFPASRGAVLLHHRVVTTPEAVFAVRPGLEALRPAQETPVANLFLAGDWTATGWPSTMEGAVRSGHLAAEGVLRAAGRPQRLLVADLPRARLARWLFGP